MKTNLWKLTKTTDDYQVTPLQTGEPYTLNETRSQTPQGAYTSFRTYHRYQVLRLTKHFNRLEESSASSGTQLKLNREALKRHIAAIIDEFGENEARLRITVDLTKDVGALYIAIEKLSVPAPEKYRDGIDTITVVMQRDNPKAKMNNFLTRADSVRSRFTEHYEEIVMLTPEKDFLEGLSSNFYAVINGTIYTADAGVLSGTTRDFVLSLAEKNNIPLVLEPANYSQLNNIAEAFITSTSRSILPIRSIDGHALGESAPGAVTKELMSIFDSELNLGLESLR